MKNLQDLKRIHVYDLDGVLVDTSHRYRNKPDGTIDLAYWFENRTPDNIMRDRLLPLAKQYRRDVLNPETFVIICTSRMEFDADKKMIAEKLGMPDLLLMRPEGNHDADGILKLNALQRIFNLSKFDHVTTRRFWDDNAKNIAATKKLFSECFLIPSKICETNHAS